MAKLFCTEESWKVINEAVQIRGGRGYEAALSLKGRGEYDFPLEMIFRDSRVNTILEGSSEIMRLFIAREALDFHLKGISLLLDSKVPVIKKLAAGLCTAIKYLFWYPKLWLPCFSVRVSKTAKPLITHIIFVKKSTKHLAREIFHHMIFYQKKLATKQNLINRFVDIAVDLFAMSAICSYADKFAAENENKQNSIDLADLFCRQARARINIKFNEIYRNQDKLSNSIAKHVLSGDFEWLEDGIIK
jgi:hypothetical protein